MVDEVATGGTLFANALSMAAGRAALLEVLTEEAFERTAALGERMAAGLRAAIERARACLERGSARRPRLLLLRARTARDGAGSRAADDPDLRALMRVFMANRGVWESGWWLGPTVSVAHRAQDVDRYVEVFEEFLTDGDVSIRRTTTPNASPHRIAAVPFTLRNLKEDLEDVGSRFDGAPDLEFRLATDALELEQSGLSLQRVPPGYRFPYGHTHEKQEEVYVVVRGSGRMKLDDEIVELKEWDAVRVPPGTWRGYEAGPEGLEIIVIGAPSLGEARRDDVEGQRDWWAD